MLRDRQVWAAVALAVLLRAIPLILWGWAGEDCTRDECIFKIAARPILDGEGLGLAPKGWLPAPGFPYLLAACHALFGSFESVKWVQVALAAPTLLALASLADHLGGPRAGRWMAWLFAVHPTFVFYAGTMWTETVYTFFLALAWLALVIARDGAPKHAAVAGVALGACILNRGIASALAPILLVAIVAPVAWTAGLDAWRAALRDRARHGGAFVLGLALTVAPYSVHASLRWGGPVISDATVGHVIAMGNDDYPPITFDYYIGQLTGRLFGRTLADGRRDCPRVGGPVAYDRCEVRRAVGWIEAHPAEFVARVPTRLAQLFNPHTFLTRHVRWGFWPGLPWELKEALVAWQAAWSYLIVCGGTLAAFAVGRGPMLLVSAGTLAYYAALIGAMYGLSRFRLPLEPLWMLWLAVALANPAAARAGLTGGRLVAGVALTAALGALMTTYLWTGWPGLG
jgi:hypothetical protein